MRECEASEAARMTPEPKSYHRHRFPTEIISHAVRLYHVFSLSPRDVELILAERGVVVTHEGTVNLSGRDRNETPLPRLAWLRNPT